MYIGLDLTTFTTTMTLEKSGHYSEVSKPNSCYPLIFVGAVISVGRVFNLMPEVLQVLFPDPANSFTSCQLALLLKEEHWVLVKGYGLSRPRKRVVRINKSF